MKKRTRKLKLLLGLACILMCLLYLGNKITMNKSLDQTVPEISFKKDVLKVSSQVTDEELLKDVKATDKKDGDVSDTVMIESISNMLPGNERVITYVAFDKDNHVGKAERRIKYKDYTPPKFTLDEPFPATKMDTQSSLADLLKPLHAEDCIDGDITDGIVVINSSYDYYDQNAEDLQMEVQVTNTSGDVAEIMLYIPVLKESDTSVDAGGEIELKEYLTYVKKGGSFDAKSMIEKAELFGTEIKKDKVEIDTGHLDINTPGTYKVMYTIRPKMVESQSSMRSTALSDSDDDEKSEKDESKTTVTLLVVVTE